MDVAGLMIAVGDLTIDVAGWTMSGAAEMAVRMLLDSTTRILPDSAAFGLTGFDRVGMACTVGGDGNRLFFDKIIFL